MQSVHEMNKSNPNRFSLQFIQIVLGVGATNTRRHFQVLRVKV